MARPAERPYVLEGVEYLSILDGAGHYLELPSLTTSQRDQLGADNGMMIYNSTTARVESYQDGAWLPVAGSITFLDLIDSPSSYSGQAGKLIKVKTDESGIGFYDVEVSGGRYVENFSSQTQVVVTHNLGVYPTVQILDSSGIELEALVTHNSVNQCTVDFVEATSGTIICVAGGAQTPWAADIDAKGYNLQDLGKSSYFKYNGSDSVVRNWKPRPAQATRDTITIYVDSSSGSDSNSGSASAPLASITKAISLLPEIVADNVTIAVSGSHTLTSPLSFAGKAVLASITIKGQDTSDNELFDGGTATSATATTITDSSKSWTTDFWAGGFVYIREGTGAGNIRTISSNTADTITVSSDFSTTPDTSSKYVILKTTIDGGGLSYALQEIPATLKIYGIKWTNVTDYAITTAGIDEGLAPIGPGGLDLRYNLFETGASGIKIANSSVLLGKYNLFQAVDYGIMIKYSGQAILESNCFIANAAGSGTGLYVHGPGIASLSGNTFINLEYGIKADLGGIVPDGSSQTFSGCTNNYVPSSASDPAYVG